jgi:hypothetical protein
MKAATAKVAVLHPVSNDAKEQIEFQNPYVARVTIQGTAPILFHRWSIESIDEKAKAAKGSKAKKTDDVESYVYRNDKNEICIPSEYLRQALIHAAKFRQDPRSPRKSAMDLVKAGIANLSELCSLGTTDWDYIYRCRVTVQRAGITRSRPAMNIGWKATFEISVLLPEYLSPQFMNDLISQAGKLIGLGDSRPSYGRFQIVNFQTSEF